MVHSLTCNGFGEQTYIVELGQGQLLVVDPGMATREERDAFQALCSRLKARPTEVL